MNRQSKNYQELLLKFKHSVRHQTACLYCGRKFKKNVKSTVDHIYPGAKYGNKANKMANLTKVCWKCNTSKQDSEPISWLQYMGYLTDELYEIVIKAYLEVNK